MEACESRYRWSDGHNLPSGLQGPCPIINAQPPEESREDTIVLSKTYLAIRGMNVGLLMIGLIVSNLAAGRGLVLHTFLSEARSNGNGCILVAICSFN
jgi:hypothetical protein